MVNEALQLSLEALLVPPGVSLRSEEDGTLVIINSVDLVAEFIGEVVTNLGADEAGGTGDEEFFGHGGVFGCMLKLSRQHLEDGEDFTEEAVPGEEVEKV
jgi:hypothetical protein